jgi:hypothetical protein
VKISCAFFLFVIVYCLIIILICYELMTYAAVKNESILLVINVLNSPTSNQHLLFEIRNGIIGT